MGTAVTPVGESSTDGVKSFDHIPKLSFGDMVKAAIAGGGGRVDMHGSLKGMYERYGPISAGRGGGMKFIHMFGPEANKFVLLDRAGVFSARRPWMQIMGQIFPNGLLLRDGEDHRQHRRIMQEAFTTPVLRSYAERMNPMIADDVADWARRGQPLLAFRAFKALTLNMAASIFLGEDLGPQTKEMNTAFEDMVAASMSRIRLKIPGLEFYRGVKGRAYMMTHLADRLAEKRAQEDPDMFSRLCRAESEEGEVFDDQDIIDHMIFLMMAAHDTTTSTLTSMMYELAKNPDWQERTRAESQALDVAYPSFEDLDQLTSLTYVMKETLRRYPPLPVIPRIVTEPVVFEEYELPEGAMVIVSPIFTHHMEEWWPDPYAFDPERFTPERAEDEKHTHSWIPFGGGAHLCIGYRFAETQMRLIMHQLLRRYEWSVPEGYQMPVQQAPISKPRDGLPIQLRALN